MVPRGAFRVVNRWAALGGQSHVSRHVPILIETSVTVGVSRSRILIVEFGRWRLIQTHRHTDKQTHDTDTHLWYWSTAVEFGR